jgi:hypothetical protein
MLIRMPAAFFLSLSGFLVLLAGCRENGAVCADDDACANGEICNVATGRCTSSISDLGPSSDAGTSRSPDAGEAGGDGGEAASNSIDAGLPPDDVPGPPGSTCGTLNAIHDDFESPDDGYLWFTDVAAGQATATRSGGGLELFVPAGAEISGVEHFTLMGATLFNDSATTRLLDDPGADPNLVVEFRLQADGDNWIGIQLNNGFIRANGNLGVEQHRVWRIREEGDRTVLELAPDAQATTWTELDWVGTPSFPAPLSIHFAARSLGNLADDHLVTFEWVNMDKDPGQWCPATDYTDAFLNYTKGLKWHDRPGDGNGSCVAEAGPGSEGNFLSVEGNLPGGGWCSILQLHGASLDESSVAIQILERPTQSTSFVGLALNVHPEGFIKFGVVGDTYEALATSPLRGGTSFYDGLSAVTTSPDWIRIRRAGDDLFFESKVGEGPFVEINFTTLTVPTDAVQPLIMLENRAAADEMLHTHLDNFNLAP